jgi:dTDP-4-amino-4,6-dideoxygalactose transaminase
MSIAATGRLALQGGAPAITLDQTEALRWPVVEQEEIQAVTEVVTSGQWSLSPVTTAFEQEFAAYHGVRYALAHNNGTAALHAAFFALGLGPGDEVIAPSATYWATAMPVLAVGAVPVFADVEPESMNIDPADVARKISPRTRAVVAMHGGGMPCAMDAILELARQHRLKVVEDASHAHGASYRGRNVGTLGDVAAFSLQTSKLCPSGEGGVLITDQQDLFERAVLLGHYERIGQLPTEGYRRFEHTGYGFKYRISPFAAALGRVALAKLDERNRRRNENIRYVVERLAELPGLRPQAIPAYVERVYYSQPWLHYDATALDGLPIERFVEAVRAEGARVRGGTELRHRGGLHTQPYFVEQAHPAFRHPANAEMLARVRYGPGTLPVTEHPPRQRISLPTFPRAGRELLDQYVTAFRKVVEHAGDLC